MQTLEITPTVPIPEHLTGEIQSKLAYVDESILDADVSTDRIVLSIRETTAKTGEQTSPEQMSLIEAKVGRVVESMAKGAIKPKVVILEDYMDRPALYDKDPMDELIQRGELFQEGTGIYTFGPLLTALIEFFERQFLKLAESYNAKSYRFPTLISAEYLQRIHYFNAFPHSLSFVTHLREDLDVIDNFASNARYEAGGLNTPPEAFSKIHSLLSPAVCNHLYFALADKPLPGSELAATAVGSCFRYEAINLDSLERLWDFSMREIIFVGPKDFVLKNRESARARMEGFFKEIGLVYMVESANDPFFIGEFRKQAAFQSAFQLKFEIRAALPFKDSTLAVGSYNYHQDFFGRNLNISLPDDSPAHTGCVAFGLERIAYAFLAQFGIEMDKWPAVVKDGLT